VKTFAEHGLSQLRLGTDRAIIAEIVARDLPALATLSFHAVNRLIIDAVAKRKRGPILVTRDSKRYVVLAEDSVVDTNIAIDENRGAVAAVSERRQ
jgi:hypothetical protein